jgi:hypothetical protein
MLRTSSRFSKSVHPLQPSKTKRAGVASLEFVMGLPFLMLVMAIIFSVAYAGVNRTKVVFQARHQVWKMREDGHSHTLQKYIRIKDTKPMNPVAGMSEKDMPGEISGAGNSKWKTYSWLMGGNLSTQSATIIITGTWDHKEITNFNSSGPHFGVLDRIGGINTGPLAVLDRIIGFVL